MLENTEGGNQKRTIQRNWQQDEDKQNKNTPVGHHYAQTNTNDLN